MKKALIFILCAITSLTTVFAGCTGKKEEKSKTETTAASTKQVPAAPEVTFAATEDSPSTEKKYDFLAIKQKSDDISEYFNGIIADKKFNGTVYMKLGNDFEYLSATGNSDTHISNSINTKFYTGSVTKQVTAAAVLKLCEENKLSLDDMVAKYIPSFENGKKITLRNLLEMTSGIKNYIIRGGGSDNSYCLQRELDAKITKESAEKENRGQILKWIKSQELEFEPGTRYSYSDSNYYLLGEIIAKASSKSYVKYVKDAFFKPLGMNSSDFDKSDSTAVGYGTDNAGKKLLYKGVGYSSLGLISSITDLVKWVEGITSGDILSDSLLKEIFTENENGYNFGLFVNGSTASVYGNSFNFGTMMTFDRDRFEVFISLTNDADSDPVYLHRLIKNYLKKFYK